MKARHYLSFCLIGLFLNFISCKSELGNEVTLSELETSFRTVPDSVKIGVYWYWISNNISKEGVIKDLQSMKEIGINRAFIGNVSLPEVAEGNIKVLSDEWWDIVHTALKTATDLGIEIGFFNGPGWSQSGGPWITDNQSMRYDIDRSNFNLNVGFVPDAPLVISLPENQADVYKFEMSGSGSGNCAVELSSKPYVEYYAEKTLAKMFPTPLPMWKDYLWEEQPLVSDKEQVLDPEKVLDLTSDVYKGVLTCHLPKGQWKVVRYAMKTARVTNAPAAPEATGLEVDKMNSKHLEFHFNAFIGEILKRISEEDRKCFKVTIMDSNETGGMNWTDDMEQKFNPLCDAGNLW
ncbi:glycosyl hydrolase [Phocaeicola sp.]|uniref:glycosyl hydrolase n=1 Tax=Phocaeicola sp. TaxID=2773926 RepID=UPI003AB799E0